MIRSKQFGKFYSRTLDLIDKDKGLVFLVIDPPNQSLETAGVLGKLAEEAGSSWTTQ